jgi:hypothetical protein
LQHNQAQGRNDEAEALLRRALVIFESALDDGHPHLDTCRENLTDLGLTSSASSSPAVAFDATRSTRSV